MLKVKKLIFTAAALLALSGLALTTGCTSRSGTGAGTGGITDDSMDTRGGTTSVGPRGTGTERDGAGGH